MNTDRTKKKMTSSGNVFGRLFAPQMRGRSTSFALVIVLFVVLTILSASGLLGRKYSSLLVPVCCYIVAALGLNMNVGISGELNLGEAGFMSLGAFTAVIVSGCLGFHGITNGAVVLLLAIIAGTLVAGFLGWLMSIPVLKLEGDYLAIVTLAFGQIIVNLVNNIYLGVDSSGLHFSFVNNTLNMQPDGVVMISGPMGATGVNTVSNFTAGFILIIVSLLVIYHIMYSRNGRAIMACRDNRIAASTVGINAVSEKTLAFVISSALGGAAGALYGLNYSSFAATKFDFNLSILILVYVVLGGLGNMTGTIIATTVLVVLPEVLRFLSIYRMLIYAVVLIVIMIVTNNQNIRLWLKNRGRNAKHGGSGGDGTTGKEAQTNG